jgi:type I restriction enzyme S subunit
MQLRHVFSVTTGATPLSGKAEYWDGEIRWVTPEDLSRLESYWLGDTRRKITQDGYESCGTTIAPRGAIVLTKRAPIGQVAVLAEPACSNQGCFLLTPKGNQDSRYYYYWLSVQTSRLQALGRGSTFMELSTDELKALRVLGPPVPQQQVIADYLDRETSRIDALIAVKQRLLRLLAEKRRALITSAVTRGLDRNTSFRGSGIGWFGEIPAHWEQTRLKFVARVQTGLALGKQYRTNEVREYPYLRVANVQDGYLDLSEIKTVSVPEQEARSYLLCAGDVLMNEGGDADKLGRGAVWTGEISPCLHQNHVFAVRARDCLPDWLALWISTGQARAYFESRSKQSTNLASISATNLMEMPLVLPQEEDQAAIVEEARLRAEEIDAVRVATERSVELLKERRGGLIAAAVTGQIDVREAA